MCVHVDMFVYVYACECLCVVYICVGMIVYVYTCDMFVCCVYTSVYMCVHVDMFVLCTYMCVSVCVCMRISIWICVHGGQADHSGSPRLVSTLFLRQGLLLNLNFTKLARLAGQQAQDLPVFGFSALGLTWGHSGVP